MKLRDQAIDRLRQYQLDREAAEIRPQHPLASVIATPPDSRTRKGNNRIYAKESRPTGRSRVPIRDLPPQAKEMANWIKHIADIEVRYARALEFWMATQDMEKVAKRMRIRLESGRLFFECGLAILQSRITNG